ncbi:MAG TPA: hypothetical protein VLJ37_12835 [bacterium]|nr:hypothetical protein [bacterium]
MLDREKVFTAFEQALSELTRNAPQRRLRPRAVAVRAHGIYCEGLRPDEKRPARTTFCMFVAGRSALPEITGILEAAGIRPATRTRLDRKRLRAVFQEAVRRVENRVFRGQAKPLQIARRAFEIYTRDADAASAKPSRHTFQRLIYGKNADPEILALIGAALKKKDGIP